MRSEMNQIFSMKLKDFEKDVDEKKLAAHRERMNKDVSKEPPQHTKEIVNLKN